MQFNFPGGVNERMNKMSKSHSQSTLYYIDALLKYSNYSKAAKSLYISQPYLTQVIKRIETQLNCELINRSKLPYQFNGAREVVLSIFNFDRKQLFKFAARYIIPFRY